jgi:hypothetical protein
MKTKQRNHMGGCALALLAVLALASVALAQGLSLKPPSLANVNGRVTARFGVAVEELPILKGELEDGLELVLSCNIGLYRINDYWMDDEIASGIFVSSLRFDPLTREYVMTLSRGEQSIRNQNIKKLLDEGWGEVEVGLGSWALLDRGVKYSLRLKTSMNEKGAPDGFMSYFYFWSWNPGAENSFQLDFTY